jgi:hypothetical protein
MAKHTQGPWFISGESGPSGLALIEDGRHSGLHPITCEWNEAPLVAAAPEMFEFLEDLQESISDWGVPEITTRLDALIAKASGQSQ